MMKLSVTSDAHEQEGRKHMGPERRLTSEHHAAKDGVVPLQRAAVPAMVPELVLALYDPLFGALSDGLHQVRVELAQLPLLVDQPRNVVADHPGAQRSDVPARAQTKPTRLWYSECCVEPLSSPEHYLLGPL